VVKAQRDMYLLPFKSVPQAYSHYVRVRYTTELSCIDTETEDVSRTMLQVMRGRTL
jgi:hypothetical protein